MDTTSLIQNGGESHFGPGLVLLLGLIAMVLLARPLGRSIPRGKLWSLAAVAMMTLMLGVLPRWVNRRVLGRIVGERGEPITGAWVVLERPSAGPLTQRVDDRGYFRFPIPRRDPEAHGLLVCSGDAEPLWLPVVPRNVVGRLRLEVLPSRSVTSSEVDALRRRCEAAAPGSIASGMS